VAGFAGLWRAIRVRALSFGPHRVTEPRKRGKPLKITQIRDETGLFCAGAD